MAVDPNIKKKADDIRNKIYGREVRESLASGLEEMSSDVVENEGRQDSVESQWQAVSDEMTDKDVISAPEIIAARNGEENLKARLDKENEEVTNLFNLTQTYQTKEFGVIGDGVTDDTEALKSLFNTSEGGFIELEPNKTYLISDSIPINTNHIKGIRGNNSKIIMDSTTHKPIFIINGGLNEEMSANPNSLTSEIIEQEKDFIIEKIRLSSTDETMHTGIELHNTISVTIQNIGIYKMRNGILLNEKNRNHIISKNNIYAMTGDGIGLIDSNVHQINIMNNHVSYCNNAINVYNTDLYNLQLVGNDLESALYGQPETLINFQPQNKQIENVSIIGNTIEDHWHCDTLINFDTDKKHGIEVVTISGNTIGNGADIAFYLKNTRNLSITDNSFKRTEGTTFLIDVRIVNATISNNTFLEENHILRVNESNDMNVRGLKFTNNMVNDVTGSVVKFKASNIYGLYIDDNFIFYKKQGYSTGWYIISVVADNAFEQGSVSNNSIKGRGTRTRGIQVDVYYRTYAVSVKENQILSMDDTSDEIFEIFFGHTEDGQLGIIERDNQSTP